MRGLGLATHGFFMDAHDQFAGVAIEAVEQGRALVVALALRFR